MLSKASLIPIAQSLLLFMLLIGVSQGIVALNVAVSPAIPWFPLPAFGLVGLAIWWASRRWSLRLNVPVGARAYAVSLLLTYAVICLGVLENWFHGLTTLAPAWPDESLSATFQLLYLITLPVIAAVMAEVCFRGRMQSALEKVWPLWPMLVFIAVLNFLMHFYDPHQFTQLLRIVALNLVWGYLTWRTQSLRPALAGHVAMNIGIAAWQYGSENFGAGPLSFGDFPPSTLAISAASGVVALVAGLVLGKGVGRELTGSE